MAGVFVRERKGRCGLKTRRNRGREACYVKETEIAVILPQAKEPLKAVKARR